MHVFALISEWYCSVVAVVALIFSFLLFRRKALAKSRLSSSGVSASLK